VQEGNEAILYSSSISPNIDYNKYKHLKLKVSDTSIFYCKPSK